MCLHLSSSQALHAAAAGLIGALAGVWGATPSLAGGRVGAATSINNSVTGALGGRPFVVSVGDEVRLRETVQTDSSGQAHLLLDDDTDVAVLSRSTITIERYAPGSKLVSAPDGTFRVHTGHGTAGEPRFETSAGTLTPEGTQFWFDVRNGRITLDVQEGAVRFCPRGKSQAFCVLATSGHSVLGSAGEPARVILGMVGAPPPAPPPPPIRRWPIGFPSPGHDRGGYNPYPPPLPSNCAPMKNCGCPHYHGRGAGCWPGGDGRWTNNSGPNRAGGRWPTNTGGGTYTGSYPYGTGGWTNSGVSETGIGGTHTVKGSTGGNAGTVVSKPIFVKTKGAYAAGYLTHGSPAPYGGGLFQRAGRTAWRFRAPRASTWAGPASFSSKAFPRFESYLLMELQHFAHAGQAASVKFQGIDVLVLRRPRPGKRSKRSGGATAVTGGEAVGCGFLPGFAGGT